MAAIEKTALAIRFAMLIAIPSAVGLTVLSAPVNNLLFRGGNNAGSDPYDDDWRFSRYLPVAFDGYQCNLTGTEPDECSGAKRPDFVGITRDCAVYYADDLQYGYLQYGICKYFICALYVHFKCDRDPQHTRLPPGDGQDLPAAGDQRSIYGRGGIWRVPWVTLVIHSNVLGTLLAVLVAVAVYGVLLIKLHCIEEDEMYSMPMGRKLTRICRKLHLM